MLSVSKRNTHHFPNENCLRRFMGLWVEKSCVWQSSLSHGMPFCQQFCRAEAYSTFFLENQLWTPPIHCMNFTCDGKKNPRCLLLLKIENAMKRESKNKENKYGNGREVTNLEKKNGGKNGSKRHGKWPSARECWITCAVLRLMLCLGQFQQQIKLHYSTVW